MTKLLSIIGLTLGLAWQAQASYYMVSLPSDTLDVSKRTHILATGKGNDLGLNPQLSAASKARKIQQAFPNDQVLMLFSADDANNETAIRKMGFTHIKHINALLNPKSLMDEMSRFSQIASFHIFGHGAIPEGLFLDAEGDHDIRWFPGDTEPKRLVGHFAEDAIATLNGCNGGHLMARLLSSTWKIPVAGTLTGTHFETLFQDGNFYSADRTDKDKRADQSNLATTRMRPDNANYNGHYGRYLQGLPIYKFFCVGLSEERCELGMAKSILMTVSSRKLPANPSLAQYTDVVREWLCPAGSWGSNLQSECIRALDSLDRGDLQVSSQERLYSPFAGRSSQCNFNTCYPTADCSTVASAWNCARSLTPPPAGQSTTFVDEYLHYLKGYQLLAP